LLVPTESTFSHSAILDNFSYLGQPQKVSESSKDDSTSTDDLFLYALGGIGAANTSDDEKAWKTVEPPKTSTEMTFILARTPASLVSYGAHIYVTIYTNDDKVGMKLSASSSQVFEKKKFPEYLNSLHNTVKSDLDNKNPS
jgi:hypothetical protein